MIITKDVIYKYAKVCGIQIKPILGCASNCLLHENNKVIGEISDNYVYLHGKYYDFNQKYDEDDLIISIIKSRQLTIFL